MSIDLERLDKFHGWQVGTFVMDGQRVWLANDIGAALGFGDLPGIAASADEAMVLTESGLVRTLMLSWRDFPEHRMRVQDFSEWLVSTGIVSRQSLAALLSQCQPRAAQDPFDV